MSGEFRKIGYGLIGVCVTFSLGWYTSKELVASTERRLPTRDCPYVDEDGNIIDG